MILDNRDNWGWGVESIASGDNNSGDDGDSGSDMPGVDAFGDTDGSGSANFDGGQTPIDGGGEDYYGQDALSDLYTPDTDRSEIDDSDDAYQGEGSWMDFQKDEDGAGSRYERGDSTTWQEDALLQFDTTTLDRLTVDDMEFSDAMTEAFEPRGQTLSDLSGDLLGDSEVTTTPPPEEEMPDSWTGGNGPGEPSHSEQSGGSSGSGGGSDGSGRPIIGALPGMGGGGGPTPIPIPMGGSGGGIGLLEIAAIGAVVVAAYAVSQR
jgi:hypothetical protein